MEEKIKIIIGDYLGIKPKEIKLDMGLIEDLNINSYDIMSIVANFEEEFNIEVPDKDVRCFEKVEDIVKYLNKKVS